MPLAASTGSRTPVTKRSGSSRSQIGSYTGEDDIERIEDVYGRV